MVERHAKEGLSVVFLVTAECGGRGKKVRGPAFRGPGLASTPSTLSNTPAPQLVASLTRQWACTSNLLHLPFYFKIQRSHVHDVPWRRHTGRPATQKDPNRTARRRSGLACTGQMMRAAPTEREFCCEEEYLLMAHSRLRGEWNARIAARSKSAAS